MVKTNSSVDKNRLIILSIAIFIWFFVVIARLFYVQVLNAEKFKKIKTRQNERIIKITPERGYIYDRNGKVLALTSKSYSIYLENKNQRESLKEIRQISKKIYIQPEEYKKILRRIKEKRRFIWILRKTGEEEKEKIFSLNLKNVHAIKDKKRHYPNMRIGCHILGTVNIDNEGLEGIEKYFDNYLKGKRGEAIIKQDARRKIYEAKIIKRPEKGESIVLTIDLILQYIAQREITKAVIENKAINGTIIVMNPITGEVLAMASYPDYNPNNLKTLRRDRRKNLAIELNYEPGSIFKVITASSVLERAKLNLLKPIYCEDGRFNYKGEVFTDHTKFTYLSPKEIISHSSNIGTIKLSLLLKPKEIYRFEKRFGIGYRTGIELPGESSGILAPLKRWSGVTQASMAIGYGLLTTPIQMLTALNVIASGGYYIPPTIVKEGPILKKRKERRVLSNKTVKIMKSFLKAVVDYGTGKKASIAGFTVAGKTGTARKAINGKYSTKHYFSSFMGFVPVEKPRLSIIVVINDPQNNKYYGGEVAAPVFKTVAEESLRHLGIFPSFLEKNKLIFAKAEDTKQNGNTDEISRVN